MEPTESEQSEEVTLIVNSGWRAGKTLKKQQWLEDPYKRYEAAAQQKIQEALIMGPVAQGLAQMALGRLAAGGKLNQDTASGSEIDMAQVIATVGTIDPTSVCEDPGCAQRGEMFKDHTVVHKPKGVKKGLRGVCPKCEGPMHNLKDDSRLIAFSCLWRQAFGEKARKTPVTAITLNDVVAKITNREITEWADRNLLLTVLAGAAPKASAAPATGSVPAAAAISPAAPAALIGVTPIPAGPGGSSGPTGVTAPTPKKAADPDKQRKLRELLKGAKVQP